MIKETQNDINNKKEERIFAGFWVRIFASLIDMIITAPLIWAVIHLSGIDLPSTTSFEQIINGDIVQKTTEHKVADFLSWIVSIAYSVYFVTSKRQATPGKILLNIYIATTDGKKLSSGKAVIRFVASIFSMLLFGVGIVMIAFTKEKIALHDLICKTRVFYGKKN